MSIDGPRLHAITGGRERKPSRDRWDHAELVIAVAIGFLAGLAAAPTVYLFLARSLTWL